MPAIPHLFWWGTYASPSAVTLTSPRTPGSGCCYCHFPEEDTAIQRNTGSCLELRLDMGRAGFEDSEFSQGWRRESLPFHSGPPPAPEEARTWSVCFAVNKGSGALPKRLCWRQLCFYLQPPISLASSLWGCKESESRSTPPSTTCLDSLWHWWGWSLGWSTT